MLCWFYRGCICFCFCSYLCLVLPLPSSFLFVSFSFLDSSIDEVSEIRFEVVLEETWSHLTLAAVLTWQHRSISIQTRKEGKKDSAITVNQQLAALHLPTVFGFDCERLNSSITGSGSSSSRNVSKSLHGQYFTLHAKCQVSGEKKEEKEGDEKRVIIKQNLGKSNQRTRKRQNPHTEIL